MRRLVGPAVVAASIAAAAVAGAQATGPAPAGLDPIAGPEIADALDEGPALVVVALHPPRATAPDRAARAIAAAQRDVLASLPPGTTEQVHRFENVPALVAVVNDLAAVDSLAADPAVARVDLDVAGAALLGEVVPLVGADLRQASGFDGTGVTVAVIDTGVAAGHPDLASSVAAHQACFGYDGGDPTTGYCPDGTELQIGTSADVPPPAADGNGHGTHVAGIVASDGVVAPVGMAPGAGIVAIKSLSDSGGFTSFTLNVVAALDYLISHPELGVDVVNLSLGTFAEFPGACDAAAAFTMAGAAAVDALRAQGVTVVAAAGGSGSGTTMPVPACLSGVISVGASDDADQVAGFSNSNGSTDVFAPGVAVLSDVPPAGTDVKTGTSMSSAVVAGCAALLIDAGQGTTPAALEERLETSSVTVTDPTNGLSFPRVDCGADLFVEKSFADPVPAGETVDLEFTVTNLRTDATVEAISFTDDLTATLSDLARPGPPVDDVCGAGSELAGSTVLTLTGGRLGPGGSCTFAATLLVPVGARPGSYPNTTGPVTALVGGEPLTAAPARDVLDVASPPTGFTKSFVDDPVLAGGTVTLAFSIDNPGTDALADLSFVDDLDAVLPGLHAVEVPDEPCGAGSALDGTGSLTLTGGEIEAGGACSFEVLVEVPSDAGPGDHENTTSDLLAGEQFAALPARDTLQVVGVPLLTKRFTDDPVPAGSPATLEFTVVNVDTVHPAVAIGFTDDLAAALPGLEAVGTPLVDACGPGSELTGTTVLELAGGSLDPGASCTFSVATVVPAATAPGSYPNLTSPVVAVLGEPGIEVAGEPAADTLDVVPSPPPSPPEPVSDLSIAMTAAPDPVLAGETLAFTIDVTNHGPDPAQDVEVVDTLPSEVSLVATEGCEEDPVGVPTCGLGTIAAGAGASYTVTVAVDPAASGTIANSAVVGLAAVSAAADPDEADNRASVEVEVIGLEADLAVTKTATPAITLGESILFTITVTNEGTSPASIAVADPLCDDAPERLTDDADDRLGPGETWVYTCELTPERAGPVTNTVTVVATDGLGVVTSRTATATATVSRPLPTIAFTGASSARLVLVAAVLLALGAAALIGRRRLS